MELFNEDGKPKILAYYLPQFYPTEFNDKWYGKGFTEWTNVGRAKPIFKGHNQPRVPTELGYYDMRLPETAEKQAELATEAGVSGFAYWHYWFGNGRVQLEMPYQRLLKTGKPDFPFCLAWANESWYKKMWDANETKKLICEQTYPGDEDIEAHFNYCLPAFRDHRYLTYKGRPIFIIYKPYDCPDVAHFIEKWNTMIRESGVADGFYFIATIYKTDQTDDMLEKGFDAVTYEAYSKFISKIFYEDQNVIKRMKRVINNKIIMRFFQPTKKLHYKDLLNIIWRNNFDSREDVLPILIPNFDHSPRSGKRNFIIVDDQPKNWKMQLDIVFNGIEKKENKLVMLRAWNEWGEGNYMEPDLKYGRGYIEVLRDALNKI